MTTDLVDESLDSALERFNRENGSEVIRRLHDFLDDNTLTGKIPDRKRAGLMARLKGNGQGQESIAETASDREVGEEGPRQKKQRTGKGAS